LGAGEVTILAFFFVGGFLTWLIQTNGLIQPLWKRHRILEKLRECDFCMGCWIFPFIAWAFNVNFLEPFNIAWVSPIITGWIASWLAHVFKIGFKAQYMIIELE
jgi:hypothetical protein